MDEFYMKEALSEAKKAYENGDVPIGAIIVSDNQIIARAYNKKEATNIATDHAEILAINEACQKNKNWRLNDCILYTTMEPCLMCAGAILNSRIKKVVYGISNENHGCIENNKQLFLNKKNEYIVEFVGGVLKEKSMDLLQQFFKEKRR